ncbi:predicted protein [Nematostella vectensis]|uniref:Ferroptosis suppressor protein 1 n=2 Tax=Nematostella vectensis TaxID=45351 RepID=A7S0N6_NEMVE|nr:predicted protein [Nematostella vectensis]|eukprot:XP_001634832.1 predicted protein [Nematostella vectensis]
MGAQRSSVERGYVEKCLIPYGPTFGDKFKQGKVVDIDVKGKTVKLANGESVNYDELVIATGTTGPFPSKLPVEIDSKTAKDQYNRMVDLVEKAQTVVVIGGGAVGVEIAGDIKEDYKDKTVTLIHPREILVNDTVSESFQTTVKNRLKYLGVETVLGERVSNMDEIRQKGFTDVTVVTDKGNRLKADLALECTGLRVNNGAYKNGLGDKMDERGRLKVDEFLQVEGTPDVYAIGDCNNTPEVKLGMLANFHAAHVGDNLKKKHEGQALKPYKINNSGFFILSCGRSGGAAQVFGGWVFGDWLARKMKGENVFTPTQWKTMGQEMPK